MEGLSWDVLKTEQARKMLVDKMLNRKNVRHEMLPMLLDDGVSLAEGEARAIIIREFLDHNTARRDLLDKLHADLDGEQNADRRSDVIGNAQAIEQSRDSSTKDSGTMETIDTASTTDNAAREQSATTTGPSHLPVAPFWPVDARSRDHAGEGDSPMDMRFEDEGGLDAVVRGLLTETPHNGLFRYRQENLRTQFEPFLSRPVPLDPEDGRFTDGERNVLRRLVRSALSLKQDRDRGQFAVQKYAIKTVRKASRKR